MQLAEAGNVSGDDEAEWQSSGGGGGGTAIDLQAGQTAAAVAVVRQSLLTQTADPTALLGGHHEHHPEHGALLDHIFAAERAADQPVRTSEPVETGSAVSRLGALPGLGIAPPQEPATDTVPKGSRHKVGKDHPRHQGPPELAVRKAKIQHEIMEGEAKVEEALGALPGLGIAPSPPPPAAAAAATTPAKAVLPRGARCVVHGSRPGWSNPFQ